jgi:short-subunit dehydrogenase
VLAKGLTAEKLCLIVGMGPGLGLEIARVFGRQGYDLVMIARRLEALAEYRALLRYEQINAQGFAIDIADTMALARTLEAIQRGIGCPQVMIYNAAMLQLDDPLTLSGDNLLQSLQVNLLGALVAAQQMIPAMQRRGNGTLLFTGSGLAFEPDPQLTSLSIGKAALRNFCYALAKALEPNNIHVATVTINGYIHPGTSFDPFEIAEMYWDLHDQGAPWEWEIIYDR